MIVRHPTAQEYPEVRRLNHVAYRTSWSDNTDEEIIADLIETQGENLNEYLSNIYFAYSADNEPMAKVQIVPLHSFLNGERIKHGGIGGVATYAEYRRTGAVRALMTQSILDMYERDYLISYLYPFSHPFYRKFGYETHACVTYYSLDMNAYELRRPVIDGDWYMLKSKDDPHWETIYDLYRTYAADYNLMVDRQADRWDRYREKDPYQGKYFTYLFTDKKGQARASFSFESAGDNDQFKIHDLAFSSIDGLVAILDFARRFRSDFDKLTLPLASDFPLEMLTTEVPEQEIRYGMVRVINVAEILKRIQVPYLAADQDLLITVKDSIINENNTSFHLHLSSQDQTVAVNEITDDATTLQVAATINLDINTLSVMLVGGRSFDDLRLSGSLSWSGDQQLLSAVFPKQLSKQNDYY